MNVKSQVATLQKIVNDVTAPAAYRARSAEIIRRYGLPIEQQHAIAAAEFEAFKEDVAAKRAQATALKAARDAATDPCVREALNDAIRKNMSTSLATLKKG